MVCRTATAQVLPPGFDYKLSPRLLQPAARAGLPTGRALHFLLQCSDTAQLSPLLNGKKDSIRIDYAYAGVLAITAYPALVYSRLLPMSCISFIDINERQAREEAIINGFDYTTNHINKVHSTLPLMTGKDNMVLIKENKPDTADIDFKGRFVSTPLSSGSLSSHATIMGTIIAGGGNSFYTARGVAPGAALGSSSFAILLPDSDAAYRRYGVLVQNHSYGTGIENYYGADAAAYDASVVNNPSLLHVFSSGNSGDQSPTLGTYKGIAGRANLTGSFKMAKNIITVGSIDSFYTVPLLSSKGPAYDGRIKPELVAYGEDGSSGAAALVSGTALLLQQVYKEQHGGQAAEAALVKAVLLNTAGEVSSKGIDFISGFGSLDAWRAVKELQAGHFFSGTVAQAQSQTFSLSLPANAKNLKLLLGWTDPPAAANAPTALVNDLD
ncbi:MAG TPA: S8 family serine peptidase, partial [Chitinophagaceae bacterium]|nr:S8 family serine peptidase [Chitinophagaceae bacterium]